MKAEQIFERLILKNQYAKAIAWCQQKLAQGYDNQFWLTNLGYVYFLDEQNVEHFYVQAPRTFVELAQRYPKSANAHFWLGYCQEIALHNLKQAKESYEQAISLDAQHPYTHLTLASIEQTIAVFLLKRAVEIQPCNLRANFELAEKYASLGDRERAQAILRMMLDMKPYRETEYGIMNEYINGVFTGALRQEDYLSKATKMLKKLNAKLR